MKHFLSFDVEDIYQTSKERGYLNWRKDVEGESFRLEKILDLLDESNNKATFFVLTEVLDDYKALIVDAQKRGHEIASHGHEHIRIWKRSKVEFEQDITKSKTLLEDLLGVPILGYRAPGFSLDRRSPWARDVLLKAGFRYSSSAGDPRWQKFNTINENTDDLSNSLLVEIPATVLPWVKPRIRVCGGFYFRVTPIWFTKSVFRLLESGSKKVNVYIHPYEFSENAIRLSLPLHLSFMRYFNIKKTEAKLVELLKCYSFQRLDCVLSRHES